MFPHPLLRSVFADNAKTLYGKIFCMLLIPLSFLSPFFPRLPSRSNLFILLFLIRFSFLFFSS